MTWSVPARVDPGVAMRFARRVKTKLGSVCALFLTLVACDAPPTTAPARAPVIYGEEDDRREYYEASEAHQRLTRESIVALIAPGLLDFTDPSNVTVDPFSLQDAYGLCDDQRFLTQPSAASCSGTLIDDDLILTAGHCFDDEDPEASCRSERFVFNYHYSADGELATIDAGRDVYSCRQILVRRDDEVEGLRRDYAIIQLDRPVSGAHVPARIVEGNEPVSPGDRFTVIGFGSGLPAKIDASGEVVSPYADTLDYFTGNIDTFGGNSGSGVFDDADRVIGILVRGATDYIDRGDCRVVNEIEADPERGGESLNYVNPAVAALCETEWPSLRVCGTERSCGDGRCTGIETASNCAEDCDAPACNDGVCDADENEASCPEDCFVAEDAVPAEWTCPPGYYDAVDGCDCECGAYDPDCDDIAQEIVGCETGETCSFDAVCEGVAVMVPDTWTCDAAYFGTGDGCDCECGGDDPDCLDPSAELFNCDEGQVCRAGICEVGPADAGTPPADAGSAADAATPGPDGGMADGGLESDGGCRAAPGRGAPGSALVLAGALVLFGRRRK